MSRVLLFLFLAAALVWEQSIAAPPANDPMGGAVSAEAVQSSKAKEVEATKPAEENSVVQEQPAKETAATPIQEAVQETKVEVKKEPPKPPLTPEISNLNLPEEINVPDADPEKVIFLPSGTYRQILQIPIDSPTMQAAQQSRVRRGPEVKVRSELPPKVTPNQKPLWVRYESLEKIKIGLDERRGGIDLPVNGPAELKPRLWYAKSEDADAWSSLFYFVFGGAGYTVANLAGWSAGNTREIPVDFTYRLMRR